VGKFFPPTLPEWHASAIGFGVGFAFGGSDSDADLVMSLLAVVVVATTATGHLAQARQEAAYAAACFVVGAVVGRAWSRRRNT
jgi:uncharacterized membrane protein YjjB (DUF3815 family)